MKASVTATLLFFLSPALITAPSAPPSVAPIGEKGLQGQPIGVLIGLDRLYDLQIPRSEIMPSLDEKKSAAYQRQWSENKDGGETKVLRYDTTPEESPYATIWLQWTSAGAKIQILRDIILPRKDGFWRFGINHSGVKGSADNDEDFFWAAPLGARPVLTHVDNIISGGSGDSTRRLTYVGPNYFSYRELAQAWGGNYGENERGFVRSLDQFGKAIPKEADYDYEHHPGLTLAQVLGSGVEPEFKRIASEGVPKESENAQSSTSVSSEDEDPCASSGYAASETDWHLSHEQGRWVALLALESYGPRACTRQADWRPLAHRLPSRLVGNDPVPVPWEQVEKAFPGARHAFASPQGEWLVVLTRNEIYLAPLSGGLIGKTAGSAKIPYGTPVMAQWALGKYVGLWDKQLSTIPAPNDDVFFTYPY
jgi:hypothetical protein